jgi:hypothetical protein
MGVSQNLWVNVEESSNLSSRFPGIPGKIKTDEVSIFQNIWTMRALRVGQMPHESRNEENHADS